MRVLVVLLLALAVTGCRGGSEAPSGSGDPAERLAGLPGVRAAEVAQDDGADDPENTRFAAVDLEPGVAVGEVVDVLRAIADLDDVVRSVVWLDSGDTDLGASGTASSITGTDDPEDSTARLLAGAALDGVQTTVDAGRGQVSLVLLDDDAGAAAQAELAEAARADEVLGRAALSVRGDAGAIIAEGAITDDQLAAWTALAGTGADLASVSLAEGATRGVVLDAATSDAPLTPQGRPDLVPPLEAALDLVRDAPAGSTVRLTSGTELLLALTTGADGPVVEPGSAGRGWGDRAATYLTG